MQLDTLKYLFRVLKWKRDPKLMLCPSCGSHDGPIVDRKGWIITLRRCGNCGLAYRRPQEPSEFSEEFYQEEYQSSLATRLPSRDSLADMKARAFQGTEKDFSHKLQILKWCGVPEGAAVLDYGASWGYGVAQLNHLGYAGSGLELSRPRAKYGEEQLQVKIAVNEASLPTAHFDAVFTNHVLEHIANPLAAFEVIFRVLKPGGLLIAFFPNGSEAVQSARPKSFHCHWGRLHPIYLTDAFLQRSLASRPWLMGSIAYGSCPQEEWVRTWGQTSQLLYDMSHTELMLLVRNTSMPT